LTEDPSLLMNGTDKFQFIKQYIYAPFPVSSLNLRTLMKLFRIQERSGPCGLAFLVYSTWWA